MPPPLFDREKLLHKRTAVKGYVLAIGAGGNGVIEGPTIGRDIANYVMSGEKSWFMEKLPLSRFDGEKEVEQHHKVTW